MLRTIERQTRQVSQLTARTKSAAVNQIERQEQRLLRASKLLEAYSYQGVLARGYALVQDAAGEVVRSKDGAAAGQAVTLTFADGARGAVIEGEAMMRPKAKARTSRKAVKGTAKTDDKKQADLF